LNIWRDASAVGEWLSLLLNRRKFTRFLQSGVVTMDALLQRQVRQRPHAVMLMTREGEISWGSFAALSARLSQVLRQLGVQKGDTVALNMENGILYLACIFAIVRLGAVAGLLNTQIKGGQLTHCLRVLRTRIILVDAAGLERVAASSSDDLESSASANVVVFGARARPPGESLAVHSGDELLDAVAVAADADADAPPASLTGNDRALYVFTSGTTGSPKAAIITHHKFVLGAAAHALFTLRATARDRLYNCLPLYHGTGLMVGAAACLYAGASMFIRPRFSASSFIAEANEYRCNLFVYVGELCRYLLETPERPGDKFCSLERAAGNGLRPDIWKRFKRRFGLSRVGEFYGASEANGGFINALNRDESIGFSAAVVRLVEYDEDEASVLRDASGRGHEVAYGDAGLLLFQVTANSRFDGYADAAASEAKLERDVFESGDCWFNSGDLLREIDVGLAFGYRHYQFVDRLGDTFRWKSENVSTHEVADTLCGFDGVRLAAVYGVAVPGSEGKAGMAALMLSGSPGDFDADAFANFVRECLAPYARPLFVRLMGEIPMTATHKLMKARLVEDGFDISRIPEPVLYWVREQGRYALLDSRAHEYIASGQGGY
jgi:citronellyl-CoA synthetase